MRRSLEEILKYCIKVNGVHAYYPQFHETSKEPLESTPEMVKKYGWNNGTVAFVTEDGSYYVTPYCRDVADVLESLGYRDTGIYVPFSNWDYPSNPDLAKQWEELCVGARKRHQEMEEQERMERYHKIADRKYLRKLPEELYKLCIEIPQDGIDVVWFGEKSHTHSLTPAEKEDKIGIYDYNNGRVSFVDSDGRHFVTPFVDEAFEMLKEGRYREGGLYVPFSNGEIPADEKLAKIWEVLCKEAHRIFEERQRREKEERLERISKEKYLKTLPQEIYDLSLRIPENGLEVSWIGIGNEILSPVSDYEVEEKVGTFDYNNGRIAFVDSKGDLYVSPFTERVNEILEQSGYRRRSLFVPLSNGEVIVDHALNAQWEEMCQRAYEGRKQF